MTMTHRVPALAFSFFAIPGLVFGQGFDPSAIFGGPSVLGRALGANVSRPGQQASFRPFISARGVIDNAFTAIVLDENGEPTEQALSGYIVSGGAYGSKRFRRSALTVNAVGGYLRYQRQGEFSGTNFRGLAGYSQQVGQKAVLNSTTMIGTWNRTFGFGFGVTSPLQEIDPALDADIDEDIFDTRTRFVSNSNSLTYSFSPRLSVSANGGLFRTDRTRGLVSVWGPHASGDIAYRLSRRRTISVSYGFNEFNFMDRYGNTFLQTVGVNHAWDLGNNWTMNLGARGFRIEIDGLRTVEIAPEIAAIIGQRTGLETFYRLNYFPGFVANLSKSFRKMSASVYASNTILPGNGVMRTSRIERYGAYYGYTGIQKWVFGARITRLDRTNLVGFTGNFRTYLGGVNVGYKLLPTLQLSAAAMYRSIESTTPNRNFDRSGWRYTFGITFSPGDIPIALF